MRKTSLKIKHRGYIETHPTALHAAGCTSCTLNIDVNYTFAQKSQPMWSDLSSQAGITEAGGEWRGAGGGE